MHGNISHPVLNQVQGTNQTKVYVDIIFQKNDILKQNM